MTGRQGVAMLSRFTERQGKVTVRGSRWVRGATGGQGTAEGTGEQIRVSVHTRVP